MDGLDKQAGVVRQFGRNVAEAAPSSSTLHTHPQDGDTTYTGAQMRFEQALKAHRRGHRRKSHAESTGSKGSTTLSVSDRLYSRHTTAWVAKHHHHRVHDTDGDDAVSSVSSEDHSPLPLPCSVLPTPKDSPTRKSTQSEIQESPLSGEHLQILVAKEIAKLAANAEIPSSQETSEVRESPLSGEHLQVLVAKEIARLANGANPSIPTPTPTPTPPSPVAVPEMANSETLPVDPPGGQIPLRWKGTSAEEVAALYEQEIDGIHQIFHSVREDERKVLALLAKRSVEVPPKAPPAGYDAVLARDNVVRSLKRQNALLEKRLADLATKFDTYYLKHLHKAQRTARYAELNSKLTHDLHAYIKVCAKKCEATERRLREVSTDRDHLLTLLQGSARKVQELEVQVAVQAQMAKVEMERTETKKASPVRRRSLSPGKEKEKEKEKEKVLNAASKPRRRSDLVVNTELSAVSTQRRASHAGSRTRKSVRSSSC